MANTEKTAAIVSKKQQEGIANTVARFQNVGEEAYPSVVDGVLGVTVRYNGLHSTEFIPITERPRTPKAGSRRD